MTDSPTPGSEWLLPVTLEERIRRGLGRYFIPCGIDILLTNADENALIPASRLTDLEAEVARLQAKVRELESELVDMHKGYA